MIRRLFRTFLTLLFLGAVAACVSVQPRGANMTILFFPVYDIDHPMMNGAGGGNRSELRWFSDPDSHPAVRPKPGVAPATADDAKRAGG